MASADPLHKQSDEMGNALRRNIEAVARLEEGFKQERTAADCAADRIVSFVGSSKFAALHAALIGVWLAINLGAVPGVPKFDPFPFLLLSVCVGIEAIFLTIFVMIKQNRMSMREDLRAHLDLQVNLLAEREMTLVLQMLQRISTRLGVRLSGDDIQELSEETSVEALASTLREKFREE